jgi:hypothetical protein
MDDPTEEEITKILRNESAHVSATLASISRSTEPAAGGRPNTTTNDIDLSELVKLRAAHETLQARNGVRNSARAVNDTEEPHSVDQPSDFKQARKEIIQKFHQLLRDADAEGERVGTGLHRNHNWVGESGNALNAAKAAEGRTSKVCNLVNRFHHRVS